MSESNLSLWNKFRQVPTEAQRKITGGRLNGKTDINPVWRMKALTEFFGPVGIGWRYEILDKRLVDGANGEIAAFVDINLFYKFAGEWSEPIPGTGGSMLIAKEKSGLYTSDECFKMALTDAISVACKALGVAADIYWQTDPSKYDGKQETETKSKYPHKEQPQTISTAQLKELTTMCMNPDGTKNADMAESLKKAYTACGFDSSKEITVDKYEKIKQAAGAALLPFELEG